MGIIRILNTFFLFFLNFTPIFHGEPGSVFRGRIISWPVNVEAKDDICHCQYCYQLSRLQIQDEISNSAVSEWQEGFIRGLYLDTYLTLVSEFRRKKLNAVNVSKTRQILMDTLNLTLIPNGLITHGITILVVI